MSSSQNLPAFHAYQVQDKRWTKIGAAWPTKSGTGFSLVLDAFPVDGRLILMPPKTEASASPSEPTGASRS